MCSVGRKWVYDLIRRKGQNINSGSYERLAKILGNEGIWEGPLSLLDKDPNHNTSDDMIANLEDKDCKGNWIKASVGRDGNFTVTKGCNGFKQDLRSSVMRVIILS